VARTASGETRLGQEVGPDGKLLQFVGNEGYQAPPLDGIWATANYFHNASVPTVYHVLNSEARPKVFTRTYRTGVEDYDAVKLGWKITCEPTTHRGAFSDSASWRFALAGATRHR